MRKTLPLATRWSALAATALVLMGGCNSVGRFFRVGQHQFLAPEKVIKQPEGSPINPIMGSIGPTDRAQDVIPTAVWPTDEDLTYTDEDYVIGPTDILDISVLDLFTDGLETVLRRQVSASGYVDLPLLTERVGAEGYTKDEFKEVVIDAYSPNVLRSPTVSVTVAARRQNTFSILGAVNRPGTYNILRKDMRLLEAVALAGGISQTNIRYIYVIRPKPATRIRKERKAPVGLERGGGLTLPPLPPEAPTTQPAATQPGVDER
ncbi:MAG: polysaccharide biosynthesis/export family protein, partial [Phycisphaerae bacterium]